MRDKPHRLTAREKNFCVFYVHSGDARSAALQAGYPEPEKTGPMLLAKNEICKQIESLSEKQEMLRAVDVSAGYERLAFGSVEGAVRLLFADDPLSVLDSGCSLFNVAEIKRPKEGALEIKFFDRLKALEGLKAQDKQGKSVSDFYRAVMGTQDCEDDRGQEAV